MTITEAREKCKSLVARVPRDLLCVCILVLASLSSFGLGFLAGEDARRADIFSIQEVPYASTAEGASAEGVVASQSGTRYYFPRCAGADRISDANKIWFSSATAAKDAGYALATNCK